MTTTNNRQCRRSTSLAYVDNVDVTAAQNRYLGEHMSRCDPHYVPRTANPFAQTLLSEEYRDGNRKIVGYSSSLSPTVFEVPVVLQPATIRQNLSVPIPPLKNSHSCPTSPRAVRRNLSDSHATGPTTCYESSSWHHYTPTSESGGPTENNSGGNVSVSIEVPKLLDGINHDRMSGQSIRKSPGGRGGRFIDGVRACSPDSELAYYSLSDEGSCGSSTPKSSSRCSNDSDGSPHVILEVPVSSSGPPLMRMISEPADPHGVAEHNAELISEVLCEMSVLNVPHIGRA